MGKFVTCLCLCVLLQPPLLEAQTPTFVDNFNRSDLVTGAPTTYTTIANTTATSGTADGGAQIISSSYLQLTNDATATANQSGYLSVAGTTSSYGSGYSATLNENQTVEWAVNFKYNATPNLPNGFGLGHYGVAVVLASNQADFSANSAVGYAIAYGDTSTYDPIRLIRFQNGLKSDITPNTTNIITSGTVSNLANPRNYASVRVRLDSATGTWSLFVRDDGGTDWADPTTVTTQIGTATDNNYTNQKLDYFGYYWAYGTAANQTAYYDNYTVTATPVPEPTRLIGVCVVVIFAMRLTGQWRLRRSLPLEPSLA